MYARFVGVDDLFRLVVDEDRKVVSEGLEVGFIVGMAGLGQFPDGVCHDD
jgi:hypothetical protein